MIFIGIKAAAIILAVSLVLKYGKPVTAGILLTAVFSGMDYLTGTPLDDLLVPTGLLLLGVVLILSLIDRTQSPVLAILAMVAGIAALILFTQPQS